MKHNRAGFKRNVHCRQGSVWWRQLKHRIARSEGAAIPIVRPIVAKTSPALKSDWDADVARIVNRKRGHVGVERSPVRGDGPRVVQKREVVFIQVVSSSGPSTEVKTVDG